MASNWRIYNVAELEEAELLRVEDGNHGEYRPRPDEFTETGTSFIRAADMDSGRILFQSASRINETALARIRKGIGRPGDVLLSSKGTVGKIALAPLDCEQFVCSPQVTFWRSLDHNFLNYQFLYYYIQSSDFRRQMIACSGESDMAPYISLTNQRQFQIAIPEIDEQKAIAHILGTIDDKITLNQEMNQTLETIAWTIFNCWFKEDNFLKNWQMLPLEECMAEIIDYRGKTPKKTTSGIPLITAKIVKNGRINQPEEYIALEDYHSWMRRGIPECGDVVMTTEAPLGEIAQLDGQKVALAQRLITLRGKPGILDNTYLKFLMQSSFVQDQLHARATGTTVLGIRQSELRQVLLAIPPFVEQKAIASTLRNLEDKIGANEKESLTLAAIRDSLLPQMLSGEIQVRNTEIFVENSI